MLLTQLHLLNFKNYEDASFEFEDGVTCLLGPNGSGKTNVLDSIYYLSFCKSYFNPVDSQNIRFGSDMFVVQGTFTGESGNTDTVYCGFARGKKKQFKRNKKEYERLSDHIGLFPTVIIAPQDADLIQEGSDVRRKLLDGIIAQFDKTYLEEILNYQRLLQQRNALLKTFNESRRFDEEALAIYDEQMDPLARRIYTSRSTFLSDFIPVFARIFKELSGGREEVSLEYSSQLADATMLELLASRRDMDRSRLHTTAGIHKDDLIFQIMGKPLKRFGSQGQQKTFLLALKLAQFEYLRTITGKKPLLLLDDIFDKLDGQRIEHLMKTVTAEGFGQVFLTDTSLTRLPELLDKLDAPSRVFEVERGEAAVV